jgi:hypothetical protein
MSWRGGLAFALLACQPPALAPTNRGQVQIEAVDGGAAQTSVTYDFGSVALGRSAQMTVRVTNTGLDALVLEPPTVVSSTTGAFFVQGAFGSMAPRDSRSLAVTFAPTRLEPESGRVLFSHNAQAPTAILEVRGRGSE